MSQQLVKKGTNGKHENVMPRSWIEAIKDKNTGQTLVEILQGFNMYFLPYNGNTTSTRCLVPTILRKKGLWITYVKYDGNVYTEWYAADKIDDKSWGESSNWRVGNNTLVGDITISANGNWVINGTETKFKAVGEKGNTPLLRVANNRLQVSYDLGDTYRNVTDNPVYTKFRWLSTSGDTQVNNVGRIQASTDEGKTWTNMSNDFINNLHISRYIGINESLPTSGIAEGTIYAKGPYYAEGDTLNDNPIYRLWVYAWKDNTLAWQDNGEFTSISAGIVQETGNSESNVMSQKATSEAINDIANQLFNKVGNINLFNKDSSDIIDKKYFNSKGAQIDGNACAISELIPVEPDTDYYLSINDDGYVGDDICYGVYHVSSGPNIVFATQDKLLHTPVNCTKISFSYYKNRDTIIQLSKSSSLLPYEPFISSIDKFRCDRVTDKENKLVPSSSAVANAIRDSLYGKLDVHHKNIFNKNSSDIRNGYYINNAGVYKAHAAFSCSPLISVREDTDYYLSASSDTLVGDDICYGFFYSYDNTKILFATEAKLLHTPIGCVAIEFSYINSKIDIQLEEGTSRSSYEEFLTYETIVSKLGISESNKDAVLPSQLYIMQGEQNSVYPNSFIGNYNPQVAYIDKDNGIFDFTGRCLRVLNANVGGNLAFNIRNRNTHEILSTYSIPTNLGLTNNTSVAKKVSIIGDSMCYAGVYQAQIASKCGNVEFVGMRYNRQESPLLCEGRGGWTLASYMNQVCSDIKLNHMQSFSPFIHVPNYNYYGVIDFWASLVNGTSKYPYGTDGFDNYISWFGTDGKKLNPSINDMMYDQTNSKYIVWNGSAWEDYSGGTLYWAFDYDKYCTIWNIDVPDFVVIELGTNDFYSNAYTDRINNWLKNMDSWITSIRACAIAHSKTIKILLCTMITESGTPYNESYQGNILRNSQYQKARKAMIEHYDTETMRLNNVFLVDTGIVVDDKYGFDKDKVLPFSYYEGEEREFYNRNGVHPSTGGYKQFGNCIAGAIQYLRT